MKKKVLCTALCSIALLSNAQVTEHLSNGAATQTEKKITNSASINQGLRLGIDAGNSGYLRLSENQYFSLFTNDIERYRVTNMGSIGVGTAAPLTHLHLSTLGGNDGLLTTDPLASPFSYTYNAGDGLAIANTNGTVNQKIELTGNPNDILLGDGTFGPVASGDADWYDVSNPGNAPTNINNSIYTQGLVGIGTLTPSASMHIKESTEEYHIKAQTTGYYTLTVKKNGQAAFGSTPLANTFHYVQDGIYSGATDLSYGAYFNITKVKDNGLGVYVNARSKDGGTITGIQSNAVVTTSGEARGVWGNAESGAAIKNYGLYGRAREASNLSCGVYGIIPGVGSPSAQTIGVGAKNEADEGPLHYGMHSHTANIFTCTTHGLYANANAGESSLSYGVKAIGAARLNSSIYGVHGTAHSSEATTNYGVYGTATSTDPGVMAYGGYFTAITPGLDYGIYAEASTGGSDYAAYIDGDGLFLGSWSPSDKNLKKDIKELGDASQLLDKIRPVEYEYRANEYPGMSLSDRHQYGVISQELEQVLPELVKDSHHPDKLDSLGNVIHKGFDYKAVNYTSLIPILVQGHKEQQDYVETLEEEVDDLKTRLEKLENLLNATVSTETNEDIPSQDVVLKDLDGVVLDQNVPNPFAEQTIIGYNIPEEIQEAELLFMSENGRIIKTIQLTERGEGMIKVFGEDLSSGMYTYTLVADGKVLDSKKMIKTK